MELTEYQRLAMRTAPNMVPQDERQLLIWTVAFAGEVGEFCNMIKKKVGHGHAINAETLADELGDCLWYTAALCSLLALDLDDVATANIDKLRRRYPNGFSQDDSINRAA